METHIKQRILVIMDQKSRLYDKPFLSNGDPPKKGDNFSQFFLIFPDLRQENDKK